MELRSKIRPANGSDVPTVGSQQSNQSDLRRRLSRSQSLEGLNSSSAVRPQSAHLDFIRPLSGSRSLEGLASPSAAGGAQSNATDIRRSFSGPPRALEGLASPSAGGSQGDLSDVFRNIYGSSPHLLEGLAPTSAGKLQGNLLDFHRLGSQSLEGRGSRPLRELRPLPDLAPSAGSINLPDRPQSLRETPSYPIPSDNTSADYVIVEMPPESLTEHQERDTSAAAPPHLEIDPDKLFDDLGIPPDRRDEASAHLEKMQQSYAALFDMYPDQLDDAIKRIDAINKYFLEMSDKLRGELEILEITATAKPGYYDVFRKYANTLPGQIVVAGAVAAANNALTSYIKGEWVWSTFASGWVLAIPANYAVRKLLFPGNVAAQTFVGVVGGLGAYKLEQYIRARYGL